MISWLVCVCVVAGGARGGGHNDYGQILGGRSRSQAWIEEKAGGREDGDCISLTCGDRLKMNRKENKENHAHDTQFPQPAAPHAEEQGDQGLHGAEARDM